MSGRQLKRAVPWWWHRRLAAAVLDGRHVGETIEFREPGVDISVVHGRDLISPIPKAAQMREALLWPKPCLGIRLNITGTSRKPVR
jgi:hypothetical protein